MPVAERGAGGSGGWCGGSDMLLFQSIKDQPFHKECGLSRKNGKIGQVDLLAKESNLWAS